MSTRWPRHLPFWLKTYPLNYLRCRCRGHQWDDESSASIASKFVAKGLEGEHYLCLSCKGERMDVFDIKNRILWARDYFMPDGYYLDEQESESKAIYLLAYHARTQAERVYQEPADKVTRTIRRGVAKFKTEAA